MAALYSRNDLNMAAVALNVASAFSDAASLAPVPMPFIDGAPLPKPIKRATILKPIRKLPGSLRNQPCPCGSGRKAKRCGCGNLK